MAEPLDSLRAMFDHAGQLSPGIPVLAAEVERLRAELARYERATIQAATIPIVAWIHTCNAVEWFAASWRPTAGGCDACESGSDNPADWRPLYVRRLP